MNTSSPPPCAWCGQPATMTIRDEKRTRMGSGSTVKKGPGTIIDACERHAAQLSARYGVRELDAGGEAA